MAKMSFEKSGLRKFFESKGLYIALAAVMTTAGIGSYAAYHMSEAGKSANVGETLSGIKASSPQSEAQQSSYSQSKAESSVSSDQQSSAPSKAESQSSSGSSEKKKDDGVIASFFVLPVANGDIVKGFNEKELQYSNTFKDWRIHTAVDFAAELGTAVKSSGHGQVTDVFYDDFLGETVVIDHGNGIIASYSGLNKSPSVKKGDRVTAGYQIGAVDVVPGECVDAPHLHLSVSKDGVVKDPVEIMKFTGQ